MPTSVGMTLKVRACLHVCLLRRALKNVDADLRRHDVESAGLPPRGTEYALIQIRTRAFRPVLAALVQHTPAIDLAQCLTIANRNDRTFDRDRPFLAQQRQPAAHGFNGETEIITHVGPTHRQF